MYYVLLLYVTTFFFPSIYSPEASIDGLVLYLMEPLLEPQASMARTTFIDAVSSFATPPKTTCLPSSHEVTTVVTKNWDPLL